MPLTTRLPPTPHSRVMLNVHRASRMLRLTSGRPGHISLQKPTIMRTQPVAMNTPTIMRTQSADTNTCTSPQQSIQAEAACSHRPGPPPSPNRSSTALNRPRPSETPGIPGTAVQSQCTPTAKTENKSSPLSTTALRIRHHSTRKTPTEGQHRLEVTQQVSLLQPLLTGVWS